MSSCSKGCGRPASRRGMCGAHYEQRRSRDTAYGRWETMFTNADPVRAHVTELRAAGMGTRTIAAAAGVSRQNVQQLLLGRPERGLGPSKKVMRRIADALLSVEIPAAPHDGVAGGAHVPAVGTVRRLRALVAIGWTQQALCERLGLMPSNGGRLFRADTGFVTADTARDVAALFGELQLTPGPSQRARSHAEKRRWSPPLAWDEDSIDDPDARPDAGLHRAVGWVERYAELRDLGLSDLDIIARWGIQPQSLLTQLRRHGLKPSPDLVAHMRDRMAVGVAS